MKATLSAEKTFKKPSVTATVLIYSPKRDAVLFIKRKNPPYKGRYAFPGGFLNPGKEDIQQAAVREVREETGLKINKDFLQMADVRTDPKRDPRDHVIDIRFIYILGPSEDAQEAKAADDAESLKWVRFNDLSGISLAFDHGYLLDSFYRMSQFRNRSMIT
mgnify:CR=1 FL=1